MSRVLIVEDEPMSREVLATLSAELGHETLSAETGEEGLRLAREESVDLVLLDIKMPGMDGLDALRAIKESSPLLPVVMVTGVDRAESAIEAMCLGAYDYLTKPVLKDGLERVVTQALEASRLMRVPVAFESPQEAGAPEERIIGRSPAMWELYKRIGQIAATNTTVLISGESGTGKELIARAIYHHGPRRDKVFLTVNCAALPETLLESELFGHEKGAFTGAVARHPGKFEQADGGVLFLDEVGDMSLVTQAKVLRVLQQKTFQRVGGTEGLTSDVRIITATNKDLRRQVDKGGFRGDLYYRLNVVKLDLPPLRERKEDIPELCNYLIRQITAEVGKPPALISAEVMNELLKYDWPGNVRELRNALARAVVRAPTSVILREHLTFESGEAIAPESSGSDLCPFVVADLDAFHEDLYDKVVAEVERRLLRYALRRTGGNKVQTAKLLGVSRNKLTDRLSRFDLIPPSRASIEDRDLDAEDD